jgi:NTE family protein
MDADPDSRSTAPGDLIATVASFDLFAGVEHEVLQSLCPHLERLTLRGGGTLITQGEPADCLYLVVHGRLRATVEDPASTGDRVVGEIGRGETVGEMALLTGGARSATVRAVRDTSLIRVDRAAFDRLVEHHPAPMLGVARLIVERYRSTLEPRPPAGTPRAFALAAGADDLAIGQVAETLVEALAAHGSVARVTPDEYRRFRDAGAGDVTAWLHEREARADRIVYEAGRGDDGWTAICMRQADTVLVVGRSGVPAPTDLAARLPDGDDRCRPRRELVLLYDGAQAPPSGTEAWLAQGAFDFHHHVDPRAAGDLARLGRMLTGTAVGVVLGGGGARGFAHIGVLRALGERGVPVDMVGGTSMGAFIGAQCACGWDWQTMLEWNRKAFTDSGSLMDYTLPLVSVIAGRRFYRLVRSAFGDRRIEDLGRAYFCVASNLTRADAVVHRSGPLFPAVATSMAIPGMVPPVFRDGEILVDGGLVNNLPADVMRRAGRGPVLAVSVNAARLGVERDQPDCLSGWQVLWSRVNPFAGSIRVPNLATILARSATLRPAAPQSPDADLLFEPPVSHVKLLDWGALDELVEIGYRYALRRLEEEGTKGLLKKALRH